MPPTPPIDDCNCDVRLALAAYLTRTPGHALVLGSELSDEEHILLILSDHPTVRCVVCQRLWYIVPEEEDPRSR